MLSFKFIPHFSIELFVCADSILVDVLLSILLQLHSALLKYTSSISLYVFTHTHTHTHTHTVQWSIIHPWQRKYWFYKERQLVPDIYVWNLKKVEFIEIESRIMVTRGWGIWGEAWQRVHTCSWRWISSGIYPFSVHLLANALGYFHISALVNNTAINMGVHVSFWYPIFICYGYIPRNKIAESCGRSVFNFLKNLHSISHNDWLNRLTQAPLWCLLL